MSDKRRKNQMELAFPTERRGEAPTLVGGGTEARVVKREPERPAIQRFKDRVRSLTRRTRGVSLEAMIRELGRYVTGWRGYFGFCETPSVLEELEGWMRRRLRSFVWKQWKRGRVRLRELRALGVNTTLAARTAGSPRSLMRALVPVRQRARRVEREQNS